MNENVKKAYEMNRAESDWKVDYLPAEDFGNDEKITDLFVSVSHGCLKGCSYQYKGIWYGYDKILKIQKKNQSNNWQAYV